MYTCMYIPPYPIVSYPRGEEETASAGGAGAPGKVFLSRPGGNPGANLKSIPHRCYLFEVAFVWELTSKTIILPLGCLQGGLPYPILGGRLCSGGRRPGKGTLTLPRPGGNPGAN